MTNFLHTLLKLSDVLIFPGMALVLSLLLTPILIRLLPHLGMVDKPGGRHIHQKATPRGGGLAIIIALFASLAAFQYFSKVPDAGNYLRKLAPPGAILVVLGVIDDRFTLPSLPKLLIQVAVGVIVWLQTDTHFAICQWMIPWYLSLPLTVFWVLLVVNAFNLIDGLDGLASGLAAISSCSMAVWFFLRWGISDSGISMLILSAACLGFLPYNFHPAKIFLGDTGSTFIGLCFAVAGLQAVDKAVTITSLVLPVLVIGVPIFDMVLAVWRRSVRKMLFSSAPGIMQGDRDHLHHRLFRVMHNQSKTALMMYLLSLIFALIALVLLLLRTTAPAVGYLLMLLAFLVMLRRLAKIEQFDSFTLLRNNFSSPRKGLMLSMSHSVIDTVILAAMSLICSWLLLGRVTALSVVFFLVPPVALLVMTKSYRVYWLRPGLRERLYLSWKIFIGTLLGALLVDFFLLQQMGAEFAVLGKLRFAVSAIYVLGSTMAISFERFLLYYVESLWYNMFVCRCRPQKMVPIMIYGAGISGRLYVRYLGCRHRENTVQPIGLLDDDTALHGMIVYGFPVYGGVERLEKVFERHPFERLVVTVAKLAPEKREILQDFAKRHGVRLERFNCHEQEF